MRPGQNKRMRGRPNTGGGGHRKGPNPLTRSYESNGPDVKIRGNAHHVAEKYLQLARDAQSSGDPVAAESYLQHAEHYFRMIASAQAAQAGYGRPADAVDADMDDEDDGIPDRFASPLPAAPAFVPPPPPQSQPYAAERQPYGERPNGAGERQPYADRQGERQPYPDRQANGERPPLGDRNGYGQRQDRNSRRPYRDNGQAGEIRSDAGQERPFNGQDQRPFNGQDQRPASGQDRPANGQERPFNGQERPDRQSRRERFAQERLERQERGYERPREPSPDAGYGAGDGGQPRDAAVERGADAPEPAIRAEPAPRPEPVPRPETPVRAEPAARPEPAPRDDDAPGLPSFITTPTRVTQAAPAVEAPAAEGATAFPGDGDEAVPKFPRRRRRTTKAADAPGEQAPPSGD